MTKPEIREIARDLASEWPTRRIARRSALFLEAITKSFSAPISARANSSWCIYSLDGAYLGEHDGIEMFTIGQRKGLPGGSPTPRYVVDIDPSAARVIVGGEEDLIREEFTVDRANWLVTSQEIPKEVTVKIRYAHPGALATLEPLDARRARVRLHFPQRAVTPGRGRFLRQRPGGGRDRSSRTALVPA